MLDILLLLTLALTVSALPVSSAPEDSDLVETSPDVPHIQALYTDSERYFLNVDFEGSSVLLALNTRNDATWIEQFPGNGFVDLSETDQYMSWGDSKFSNLTIGVGKESNPSSTELTNLDEKTLVEPAIFSTPDGQVILSSNLPFDLDGSIGISARSSHANLVSQLQASSIIDKLVFSLYLAPNSPHKIPYAPENTAGIIIFGSDAESLSHKFTDKIHYSKVVSSESADWLITLSEVTYNDISTGSRMAIIDTTSMGLLLPLKDANELHASLFSDTLRIEDGVYSFPCHSKQSFAFTFAGSEFSIPAASFMGAPLESFPGYCVSKIQASSVDTWVLGSAFLENFYTVFNIGENTIGFGSIEGAFTGPESLFSFLAKREEIEITEIKKSSGHSSGSSHGSSSSGTKGGSGSSSSGSSSSGTKGGSGSSSSGSGSSSSGTKGGSGSTSGSGSDNPPAYTPGDAPPAYSGSGSTSGGTSSGGTTSGGTTSGGTTSGGSSSGLSSGTRGGTGSAPYYGYGSSGPIVVTNGHNYCYYSSCYATGGGAVAGSVIYVNNSNSSHPTTSTSKSRSHAAFNKAGLLLPFELFAAIALFI